MKSYSKPTSEQLDAVIPRLSSPQHEAYFFSKLQNPLWVKPLAEHGLFDCPPEVEHTGDEGVLITRWPASRYLARMAEYVPAEVANIFQKIDTNNTSIIGDMLDASLKMPAENAALLVPNLCKAAKEKTLWHNFDDAGKLCVHLAEGGESGAAFDLAIALFAPTFEKGKEEPSRRDVYWYKDELKKVTPVLARLKPMEFLPKLCEWLNLAVEAKGRVDADTGSDFSYIWRPAIEEHSQNKDYYFAGEMVGYVREGFEEAIRNDVISLGDALDIVDRYKYVIFKRLRLHLIGEFAQKIPDLACKEMLYPKLFDDYDYKHEYAQLMGKCFGLLSPDQQKRWLGWIDAGPDMTDYDNTFSERAGRAATPEDRQKRINYWKYEKLHWIRQYLKDNRKEFYERMVYEHGEPEMADLNYRIGEGMWEAPESPMTVEALQGMTFQDAVNKVSSWEPETPRFMGPSVDGLASTFNQYVATNPEVFSGQAEILIGRPAIYIRSYLSQMSEAAKKGKDLKLSAIFKLCDWIIEQPVEERTSPAQKNERTLVDKDWQWTRDSISDLIENICKAELGDKPRYGLDIRDAMWKVINPLCYDRADSYVVRDTDKEDPRVCDYLDLSINSPRGKAIEAILEYARWVANHIKIMDGKREIVPNGFDSMPEVRKVLDEQISPKNRSIVSMSLLGLKIPLIYWIDKQWLENHAQEIFQLDVKPIVIDGWAAWNTFLTWIRPHIEYYRLFKSQYAYAVEQSGLVEVDKSDYHQPMFHLGEHLMLLYGRGQLELEDDNGLLRWFIEHTNSRIRRHAINFVGNSLKDEEELPIEIIHRFQKLWDYYWTVIGRQDAKEKPQSPLFGIWFACGKFPASWTLGRLEEFIEIVPSPEPDRAIAIELEKIAVNYIEKSVEILDKIVRADKEGWHVYSWHESAKKILELAIKSSGEAKEKAEALIDYFGRRGYTDFGELLG